MFSISDLKQIHECRIGEGKIGGKAAGMLLAWKILQQSAREGELDISDRVSIPESYYLGTDVIYEFHHINSLETYMNQKYRPLNEIRSEYPHIVEAHLEGQFPVRVVEELREVLRILGDTPIIVRSSSLLEDNFGHAFAGKYQSHFCPNQGTEEENLERLLDAIRRIYASALNPDAILYRQRHNLIDYDERMAVLIQPVRGEAYGRYYFPAVAGVAFSKNPFRWNHKIRREDGFLRIVWGMGTRAVDRVSDDYPRMVALSHPQLRPETTADAIQQYSQHYVDVIDLEANQEVTLPVHKVLDLDYPFLRYVASIRKGDYVQEIVSSGSREDRRDLVLTFDRLVHDQNFIDMMQAALTQLERAYETPVDIEFVIEIIPDYPYPSYRLHLLQCRPLTERGSDETVTIPPNLPEEDILFTGHELIPDGRVDGVRYVIFVDPIQYRQIADPTTRLELGRAVGRLNKALEDERFVLMGPGRWGSANLELGVRVGYADIFNTQALIEMSVPEGGSAPDLSYGTHFFQDLIEGGIFPLPLHLHDPRSTFDWSFFRDAPNALATLSPEDADLSEHLKVLDVEAVSPGRRLTILMDGSRDEAVGYLA